MRRAAVLGVLAAAGASAHAGGPVAPSSIWTAWAFDPGMVVPLALTAWLFLRAPRISGRRKAAFWTGWLALVIALVSPIHFMGEVLFSAHMVQHEIMMLIAAPLLVASRPMIPLLLALPLDGRRALGRWAKTPWFRHVWGAASDPVSAWAIHGAAIWIWHIPALFEATLTNDLVHTAQHISFLFSALLFWWALLHGRQGYGAAVLYVFTTGLHTGLLGAFLTLSSRVWYPAYTAGTAVWGLTPLADQQLGGLIMWVPAGMAYIISALWLLALWLRGIDARVTRTAVLGCAAVMVLVAGSGCNREHDTVFREAATLTGGDPAKGRHVIEYYGCGSCHTIYGVNNANGQVGPPLTGIARRMYIGGVLENTPDNMVRWIMNPKAVDEKTAMPYLGVKPSDARDITGYLYTLR